jgi:hypothetical protein
MAEATRETRSTPARNGGSQQPAFAHPGLTASEAAVECFKEYARERPEIVTLWALGIGFVLGWKLRIW